MRKLAIAAFSFTAATFLSRYILPYDWLPVCFAVAAALTSLGLLFRNQTRLRVFIALASLSVGLIWSWAYTALFIRPSWDLHNETMSVSAIVKDYPSPTARGYRVDCIVIRESAPRIGARLYYSDDTPLAPGDVIEFTARFRRTDGAEDDERVDTLSSRGAFFAAYATGRLSVAGSEGRLRYFPQKLSRAVAEMIDRIFAADVSPFMKALLTGKRDDLYNDAALNSALSASGISHVVAVSGMHVSFLMGFLALVVKNKRLFAMAGIPALFLFMAMTGFTPSVTRAGIMQIFLICAPLFKRESDSVTSLSAALLLLLIINPYSAASAGLQLSFSATLGIILITGRIDTGVRELFRGVKIYRNKLFRHTVNAVTSSLATTAGALVFTLPLMVMIFGAVSLISPLTNLLTLWAVSLAFPIGLAACILGFIFTPLGSIIAFPAAIAVRYITGVARLLAAVPFSIAYSSNAPVMFWLAYIYVMFITLPLLKARARQYIYPVCIAVVLLCAILLITPLFPAPGSGGSGGGSSVSILDVGQGQSVVICSGDYTAVIDCGSSSRYDAGSVTHEFLLNLGRASVDLLVLTHFHSDHVNGVEELMSKANISALAIPDPDGSYLAEDIIELARRRGTEIIYVMETFSVSLGETTVMLYPPVGFGDENEQGLSVLTLGGVCALITGDMTASGERSLLRFAELPVIDVLIVGHHGSRFSTSEELLAAVRPDIAVISVGANSYGHPSGEVLERLYRFGAAVFRTDELGDVTVSE